MNPGRPGIFGLGGALAEIEVGKLSDLMLEDAKQAAERQAQMDEATGVAPPVRPRQSRQTRQSRDSQHRERPSSEEASGKWQNDASRSSAGPRTEARKNRRPAPNRQRHQGRLDQRTRQDAQATPASRVKARTLQTDGARVNAEREHHQHQRPVSEPIENREELETLTSEVLGYLIAAMNVNVEAYVLDDLREGSLVFEIEGTDAGLLIGRRGETLRDFQFIVRMLVNRQLKQRANIIIDVERYQLRRTQKLHTIAESAARSASHGRARSLDPMTPEERRIVHMALSDNPQVVTESEGQGAERHVVVKPR